MPQSKPVDLCTHLLPSGKLCRGIALRNERLCRSHIRNHRLLERERQHNDAMLRLCAELETMDFLQLLQTLEEKLSRITSIVRAYPEAKQTLAFILNRLCDLNSAQHQQAQFDSQIQSDSCNPYEINQVSKNPFC